MSQPETNDEHIKIATVDNSRQIAKNKPTTSFSEGNMLETGAVPKAGKNIHAAAASSSKINEMAASLDALKLTPTSSDENVPRSELVRAKDSLEHLPCPDIITSKSTSCTTPANKPPQQTILSNAKSSCSSSVSKVLAWDPWEKLGRKNKKENKRRKNEKNEPRSSSPSKEKDQRKDYKSGDEGVRQQLGENQPQVTDAAAFDEYAYQPFQKTIRSVEFTNKVMVVYINKEDKVVGEASEPLKKELEQQMRNKEMRRGHMPDVTFARRNTMSEWFKK